MTTLVDIGLFIIYVFLVWVILSGGRTAKEQKSFDEWVRRRDERARRR